jgi:hypothetical protein
MRNMAVGTRKREDLMFMVSMVCALTRPRIDLYLWFRESWSAGRAKV